ncbi:hypothetical protein [Chromobacterium paludis]|uniref:Uncharacterized protein n=1 Tax=Chromobacterium paludis TaxID=2605945 RepID=A0A5C1DGW6_9NEIS|nr:hypothetical protein [Chromobacterium paludis]QEL55823.1 hypothetical protein FYK34_09695 [Chromobacterium paludis]
MNAAKKMRLLLERNESPEQLDVLIELLVNLQLGRPFDLRSLATLDAEYFEIGLDLVRDWRYGYHICARSKLFEDVLARDRSLQTRLCHLGVVATH